MSDYGDFEEIASKVRSRPGAEERIAAERDRVERELSAPVRYVILVHQEGECLWVEVPGLPGCFASGETLAEALACVAEAIEIWEAPSALRPPADG